MSDVVECPVCYLVSHHPVDARTGWCDACKRFTSMTADEVRAAADEIVREGRPFVAAAVLARLESCGAADPEAYARDGEPVVSQEAPASGCSSQVPAATDTRTAEAAGQHRSFHMGPVAFHGGRTNGWIRIFGVGLWWKDRSRHRLYFSERNWISPFHFAIGTWHFKFMGRIRV